MAYWLVKNHNFTDKFIFNTVAFAGPDVVNKRFRDHFLTALPPDGSFHMMVNSLDVIPYLWADLPGISANSIPVHVPHDYKEGLRLADSLLQFLGIKYYNITHWVGVEHNHDNYLKLLGVKPLKP